MGIDDSGMNWALGKVQIDYHGAARRSPVRMEEDYCFEGLPVNGRCPKCGHIPARVKKNGTMWRHMKPAWMKVEA